MPAATTAATTSSTPITGQGLLPPVLLVGAGSGRALPAAAEPEEESPPAPSVLTERGVPVGVARKAGGGRGVSTGVGGGGDVGAGGVGASVAAIAVIPVIAVWAAAVLVCPITGACAATGCATEFSHHHLRRDRADTQHDDGDADARRSHGHGALPHYRRTHWGPSHISRHYPTASLLRAGN